MLTLVVRQITRVHVQFKQLACTALRTILAEFGLIIAI